MHNKSTSFPRRFLFFDTETIAYECADNYERHKLRFGVYCYVELNDEREERKRQYGYFQTPEAFWDVVVQHLRKSRALWIVAHNIGFDLRAVKFAATCAKFNWRPDFWSIDDPPTFFRFVTERGTFMCVDSFNYFPMSLAKIGSAFGYEKGQMPTDETDIAAWYEYCKRDVDVLVKAVLGFIQFVGKERLGKIALTLGSQALTGYRHGFMPTPIRLHNNEIATQLEREAYHGGRTECFRIGRFRGDFYFVDVNSMYPFVMRTFPVPTRLYGVRHAPPIEDVKRALQQFGAIARCYIDTDEPIYPLRHKDDLVFPVGRFMTTLTTPELQIALARGDLLYVERIAYYSIAVCFREYIDYLYKKRLEYENAGQYHFAYCIKLLMNSLYGKFGQKCSEWKAAGEAAEQGVGGYYEFPVEGGPPRQYRYFLGVLEERVGEGEATYSFPAIAAHITAYARLYLYGLMQEAGRENVFYCDTDGFIVNKRGYERLKHRLDETELGKLKVSYETKSCRIYAPKDYEFGARIARKGISSRAIKISKYTYEQHHFLGFRTALLSDDPDAIVITTVRKTVNRRYNKGIKRASGVVDPLVFALLPPAPAQLPARPLLEPQRDVLSVLGLEERR